MTDATAALETLVWNLNLHFQHNKKRPAESKIETWIELNTPGWKRAMKRKALRRCTEAIDKRYS